MRLTTQIYKYIFNK